MTDEFDASSAVATALGDAEPDPSGAGVDDGSDTSDPPTDAGADDLEESADADTNSGGGGRSPLDQLQDRLLSTEPSPPLDDPSLSTWDSEHGGKRRIKRGLYKALGVEGATALEDLALGIMEFSADGATDRDGGGSDGDERGGDGADRELPDEGDPLARAGVGGA